MRPAVVLFARTPEKGKVKTRLGAHYGDDAALMLHEAFIADTLDACVQAGVRVLLAHTNGGAFAEAAGVDAAFKQEGDSFGERFDGALRDARRHHGEGPLVILGADTPHLGPRRIQGIFAALERHEAVVGPAPRGGFYALGFQAAILPVAQVFQHADEITALERLFGEAGVGLAKLPAFYDLDHAHDVERLRAEFGTPPDGEWVPAATMQAIARLDPGSPTERPADARPRP